MKAAEILASRYPYINGLLTNRLVDVMIVAAAVIFVTQAVFFAATLATATDYVTLFGPVIGGDFVVFDKAAEAVRTGEITATYDRAAFSAQLAEAFPAHGEFRLSWQYPPTAFLFVWPLAFLPYLSSYALWIFAGGGLFLLSLRKIWDDRAALVLIAASPAAFQSVITGQTGFFTAALFATALLWADRRPLLAGLAVGLLSVKPQLGLLIPVAFAAGGFWRAFGAAATASLALGLVSVAVFGAQSWSAFFDAIRAHGALMQSDAFPVHKLVSVFGGAIMLGAPAKIALALQIATSAALVAVTGVVWRRLKDRELRAAALCAAALLAAPYAFYYEIALLIPPALIIAKRGVADGWLPGERPALALMWLAPLTMPGPSAIPSVPVCFFVAAGFFALVMRRVAHALRAPQSAGRQRPSGSPA